MQQYFADFILPFVGDPIMPKKQGMSSFQKEAQSTDKYTDPTAPTFLAVPFLSMTEEAGQLARIYKEIVVSGNKLSEFQQKEIKDKLGDLLWYIANISKKLNIDLDTVAIANLQKTKNWWLEPDAEYYLYDKDYEPEEQLPREITFYFKHTSNKKAPRLMMFTKDETGNILQIGDPLDDNNSDNDGYRFHDVFHLSYAAILGWSPVLRSLLKKKRKSTPDIDRVQDGGRAIVIEEGLTAHIFQVAKGKNMFRDVSSDTLDRSVVKMAMTMTSHLEVQDRSARAWSRAIFDGYTVFNCMVKNEGGKVKLNLNKRTIEYFK